MMKRRPPPGRGRAAAAVANLLRHLRICVLQECRHCSDGLPISLPPMRESPLRGSLLKVRLRWFSLAESDYDVREHVLDLVAHRKKDHDDHDRNEDEDQSVLNHALAFLTGRKTAELPVKTQHCIHLLFPELRVVTQLDGPSPGFLRAFDRLRR